MKRQSFRASREGRGKTRPSCTHPLLHHCWSPYQYLARLRNASRKNINQLKTGNGKRIIEKQDEILKETVDFYSKLYTKEDIDVKTAEDYIFSQNISSLSDDENKICEGLLTHRECKQAVFEMKKNRTPGSDGITAEFYQVF